MKAEVHETGALQREVEICLDSSEVRDFIDEVVNAYRRRHAFPGFRPGKATAGVVMARFHEQIEQAVLHELVPRTIERVLAEKKIRPAGPGKISRTHYELGQPLTVRVQFEVWPEFELKPYDGMEVDQLIEEVSPQDLEDYLTWMRERSADLEPVDREARGGDILEVELESVDVEGKRIKGTDKEKTNLEVGGAGLLPEFRAAAQGIRVGESSDLKVDYPEDYSAEELRGQTRRYRMTAVQISEKKIQPLDDDFARKLDPSLDLEGLRARVRLRLESEKRMASRERLEHQIVDRLIRENPFDLPESSIRRSLDRLVKKQEKDRSSMSREEVERIYRPHIERAHQRELIMVKVAEREGVHVSSQDAEGEIARIAREEKRDVEDVRKDMGDLDRFRDFLIERGVFEALLGKVKVREVTVPSASEAKSPAEALCEIDASAGAASGAASSAVDPASAGGAPPDDERAGEA
ncbi:MAG: trigger factor [Candidatus Eisenbacteria sp.]|nr:trigger factor [Candidatus Eisenbacteria bacterium]